MLDPGLDRHDWESQWASLEDDIRESPREVLVDLERLLAQMLEETQLDPGAEPRDDEPEVLAEFRAGQELRRQAESEDGSAGDVAATIEAFRLVYETLIDERRTL